MKPIVEITEVFNSEQVKRISGYIINDRPDIFWYRGKYVVTTLNNVIIRIEFHYVYTESQKEILIRDIENSSIYKQINLNIKLLKTDFEKALKLYELIIQNTEYENISNMGESGEYLRRRAIDMNIRIMDDVQDISDAELSRKLKSSWCN